MVFLLWLWAWLADDWFWVSCQISLSTYPLPRLGTISGNTGKAWPPWGDTVQSLWGWRSKVIQCPSSCSAFCVLYFSQCTLGLALIIRKSIFHVVCVWFISLWTHAETRRHLGSCSAISPCSLQFFTEPRVRLTAYKPQKSFSSHNSAGVTGTNMHSHIFLTWVLDPDVAVNTLDTLGHLPSLCLSISWFLLPPLTKPCNKFVHGQKL